MINIIDIAVGILVLIYLAKNVGGVFKTARTIVMLMIFFLLFGLLAQIFLSFDFAPSAQQLLRESYSVSVSRFLFKWVYPPLRDQAPKLDTFINDKIIKNATGKVEMPKAISVEKAMPKISITIPEIPGVSFESIKKK